MSVRLVCDVVFMKPENSEKYSVLSWFNFKPTEIQILQAWKSETFNKKKPLSFPVEHFASYMTCL